MPNHLELHWSRERYLAPMFIAALKLVVTVFQKLWLGGLMTPKFVAHQTLTKVSSSLMVQGRRFAMIWENVLEDLREFFGRFEKVCRWKWSRGLRFHAKWSCGLYRKNCVCVFTREIDHNSLPIQCLHISSQPYFFPPFHTYQTRDFRPVAIGLGSPPIFAAGVRRRCDSPLGLLRQR